MKTIVLNKEFRDAAATDARMQSHVDFVQTARNYALRNERHILGLNAKEAVHVNAGIPVLDFFRDTDRNVDGVRLDDKFVFMQDLADLAKTVSVGKLSAVSLKSSDISDDVSVSMDFNASLKGDHISADSDRNPIPAFMAAVVMGYRHREGLDSEGLDLYNDSVILKTRKVTEKVGDTMLNGNITIKADGQACEGIKNHRNTQKLNLGAAGYNIDLTSATRDEVVTFFNKDMKLVCNSNTITKIDMVGVSPEIMVNLNTPLSNAQGFKIGTLLEEVLRFAPHIGGFVEDFALTGNEFYAYKRDASVIRPIVAMATGSFLLPRQSPIMGYTTQIVTAQGIEIKKTMNNKYGVFYASVIS